MPVHPSEEITDSNLTEKVAKDPSSTTGSTASEHSAHFNEHNPGSGSGGETKAKAQDHMAKGPQIPVNMNGGDPQSFFLLNPSCFSPALFSLFFAVGWEEGGL